MMRGMKLDLGHASLSPALTFEPGNLRLEHRKCNRQDGQRIATGKRATKTRGKRMPSW